MKNNNEKGFTLVELAIVLVIIGLLIGGILAAQSMISTAKVNAVAMQIGQFDAGVENFKTKYNYLPGDAPAFGGDGDGLITMGNPVYPDAVNSYTGEILNFWSELFPDKYVISSYAVPGAPPNPNPPNANVPLSKLGASGSFFMVSALANASYFINPALGTTYNYYAIVSASSIRNNVTNCCYQLIPYPNSSPAVKAVDEQALDLKIDDGNGLTGNVQSNSLHNVGDSSAALTTYDYGAGCINLNGSYIVSNNSYQCTPIIRIGASVNDLQ